MVLASITDQKQKDKFTLDFARLSSLNRIKPAIADWLCIKLLNKDRSYINFLKWKCFDFEIYTNLYYFIFSFY